MENGTWVEFRSLNLELLFLLPSSVPAKHWRLWNCTAIYDLTNTWFLQHMKFWVGQKMPKTLQGNYPTTKSACDTGMTCLFLTPKGQTSEMMWHIKLNSSLVTAAFWFWLISPDFNSTITTWLFLILPYFHACPFTSVTVRFSVVWLPQKQNVWNFSHLKMQLFFAII